MDSYMHSQTELNIVSKAMAGQQLEVNRTSFNPMQTANGMSGKPRQAAVAAILKPSDSGLEVLFIRRAESENDPWSGHMAFPGGHFDACDKSLVDTAIRETKEEIGIDLNASGRLLGVLSVTKPHARQRKAIVVSSFVFVLQDSPLLQLNYEVEEVVVARLEDLMAGGLQTEVEQVINGKLRRFDAFDVSGHIVWGMTYNMVQELLMIIRPDWPTAQRVPV